MANSDKNILITPSVGLSTNPTIKFNGANNTPTTLRVLDDGTVSFEGTAGQLFSISDGLTGSIFSVNDISGIPSIEVLDTGLVKINQYGGSTVYGASAAIQNGSLVNAKVSISTASATTPGLIIKGVSSQSANLQEWQNSSGTVITKIDANGAIDSTVQITGRSAVTAGTGNYLSASLNVVPLNASIVGAVIRGYASQTADLQQWQSSAGTALAKISSAGRLVIASDGEISSSQIFTSIAVAGGANVTTSSTANDYSIALNASGGVTGSTVGMAFQVWGGTGFNGIYQPGAGIWFTRTGGYSAGYLVFATRESSTPVTTVVERMRIGETGTISIAGFTASSQGLIIKAAASQTANLQEWQNSDGTVLAKIDSSGSITAADLTLSGNLTVNGTTTNLNSTNLIIEDKNIIIADVATPTDTTADGAGITVKGATDKTFSWSNSTKSFISSEPLIINSAYSTTVGLIVQAATGQTSTNIFEVQRAGGGDPSFTVSHNYINLNRNTTAAASLTVYGANSGAVPLYVIGRSSQSVDLQQWQNSSGNILAAIKPSGQLKIQNIIDLSDSGPTIQFGSSAINIWTFNSTSIPLIINAFTGQTADLQQWKDSSGNIGVRVNATGNIVSPNIAYFGTSSLLNATLNVQSVATSWAGIAVKGIASQTGDLQSWYTSGGNKSVWVDASGQLGTGYFFTNFGGGQVNLGLVTISGTGDIKPLVIRGVSGQTQNLQEWQNNSGTALAYMSTNGHLVAQRVYAPDSLYVVANGGPGTVNIETYSAATVGVIIKGKTSQSADLQQWQNVNGIVFAKVDASGNIGVGAGTTALTYGLDIFTGSARIWNGVTGAGQTGTLYLGDGSLTKAYGSGWAFAGGLVTTGGYGISSNGNLDAGGTTLGYGRLSVNTGTTTTIGAVIRGVASQTANLQEWQNSSANILAQVNAYGSASFGGNNTLGSSLGIGVGGNASQKGITVRGTASQTANLTEWQDSAGTIYAFINPFGQLSIGQSPTIYSNARISINTVATTVVGQVIRGTASQTADLQQWQNSAGTVLAKVDASGNITAPSYNLSDSKYLLRKTIKKTVDPAQNAVANNTYDLFDMNFSSSLQGTFYIQASIRGGGYGQNLTYSLPATYVMDWINQYAITNPFTNSTTWVDLTPLTFSPRHLMTNDYFKFQAKVNANQISFRIKLTGTLTGAPVFDIYIQHSEEFANSTITELNTTGTDATTSNVMPNFLSSKAGLSAIFNPITLYSNSASNIPLTIKGFASQSANLQEWQDSSANVIAKVDASGVTSVRSIRSANTIPNASVVDNTLYNLGVGPNASSYGISWLRVKSGYAGDIVSVFEGTTSQTGDLTQWKNSAGTLLAKVDSTGQITSNVQISSAISTPLVLQNSAFGVGTGTNITMNYGSRDYVKIESAYATSPGAVGAYLALKTNHNAGASATTKLLIDNQGTVTINGFVADAQGLIVKGAASQSVDLQQWQNSAGSVLAKVDASGYMGSIGVFSVNGAWSLEDAFGGSFAALKKTTSTVTNPGSDKARIYLVAGTTAGTLKLVVRAGASGAETTILDNIPQS